MVGSINRGDVVICAVLCSVQQMGLQGFGKLDGVCGLVGVLVSVSVSMSHHLMIQVKRLRWFSWMSDFGN